MIYCAISLMLINTLKEFISREYKLNNFILSVIVGQQSWCRGRVF